MKKTIFIIAILLLILLAGCEKNYKRTIWINPDVECCGVKDPLNNLEWLNEWYEDSYFNEENELDYQSYGFIYVFKNDSTSENFVVTRIHKYNNYPSWFQLYTCDGELIDEGIYQDYNSEYVAPDVIFQKTNNQYIEPRPCIACYEFFNTHILVDTMIYFYTNKFLK